MKLMSMLLGLAMFHLTSARQECRCNGKKALVHEESKFCCLFAPGSYLGLGDCLINDDKVGRFDLCCRELGYASGLYCI